MSDDWANDLAKEFKKRNNPSVKGAVEGKVIEGFPNLKVSIYDGKGILTKKHLYISDSVSAQMVRSVEITGDVEFDESSVTSYNMDHTHDVNFQVNAPCVLRGSIKLSNGLKEGDKVLVMPTESKNVYVIVDRIRKLV